MRTARVHHAARRCGGSWPLAARAQQGDRERRIGLLDSGTEPDPIVQAYLAAFREELEKLGWIERQNVRIDYRFAHASAEQGQVLAKELVALRPDVILAHTTPMAAALQRESRAIPIVFVEVSDPINSGFVASLARPGGNLTGLLLYEEGITGKWLAMLKEIAPHLVRVALVANPKTTPVQLLPTDRSGGGPITRNRASAQPSRKRRRHRTYHRLVRARPKWRDCRPPDSTAFFHRDLIIRLAAQHHLPSAHSARWWVEGGALMSYGTDRVDAFRQVASFVDRILRGSNPGDLPVQTPTKYETVLNLKNGEGARPRSPASLLVRADEVIE